MIKEPIKNIIFDLGGVILNIDYRLTVNEFRKLGFTHFDQVYSQARQSGLFDKYEKGWIKEREFVEHIKSMGDMDLEYGEVVNAWNAMILDFPMERLQFIEGLRSDFKVFLLSNTNHTHQVRFEEVLIKQTGLDNLSEHFDALYYSHQIGMRKPDKEVFEFLLSQNSLEKKQTLFIDDSIQHIHGAREAGIQAVLLQDEDVISLVKRVI